MEVIVDDTQLSLAIGKKGQNVRLAAKLLGWKIDIKSEEEKRQEVESIMANQLIQGAPVSILMEHGLDENVVELLVQAGIGTVEKLGAMTPEQLEEIREVTPEMVEQIQIAVNNYYGQFEPQEYDEAVEQTETAEEIPVETGEAASEAELQEDATDPQDAESDTIKNSDATVVSERLPSNG